MDGRGIGREGGIEGYVVKFETLRKRRKISKIPYNTIQIKIYTTL